MSDKQQYQQQTRGSYKQQQEQTNEDSSSKELNSYVQNLLKQMQDRFEDMSGNIVGRIDEMNYFSTKHFLISFNVKKGNRIDDIEKNVSDLMNDLGLEEQEAYPRK